MKFVNEYEMTRKRFSKWSTPNIFRISLTYVWIVVGLVSAFAWIYFAKNDTEIRWQTLAAFMVLIAIYRGFLFRHMAVDKTYRLTKANTYKGEPWMCKVEINDGGIRVSANGTMSAYVKWDRVSSFQEAKTFLDLKVDGDENQARLDKESFTEGDVESFKQYMREKHSDIPYKEVEPAWNK